MTATVQYSPGIYWRHRGGQHQPQTTPPPSFPIRNNQMTGPGVVRVQRRLQINLLLSAARHRGLQRHAGLSGSVCTFFFSLCSAVSHWARGSPCISVQMGSEPPRPGWDGGSAPRDARRSRRLLLRVSLYLQMMTINWRSQLNWWCCAPARLHSLALYSLCSQSNHPPTPLIMQDQQFLRSKPLKL